MDKNFKIIIIDDDESIINTITENLKSKYRIIGYTNSKDGLEALKNESFDMLILDYFIDNIDGKQIVEKVRKFNDSLYIMLLTGKAEEVPGLCVLESMDIQMYCEKSANFENLLIMIESAIKSTKHANKDGSFGVRLKNLRKSHNMSQEDLGKILGVGRTTIANWETNQTELTSESIKKIAEIFKVTTDYLLCFKPNFD